jgi:hypothetical protein
MWLLIIMGALGAWAVVAMIAQIARDGYGQVPTRAGTERHRVRATHRIW